jgi:hypothetical protein
MFKEVFEGRKNVFLSGEHLEQCLIDAGFVDIQVFKKIMDVGDWRGGFTIMRAS